MCKAKYASPLPIYTCAYYIPPKDTKAALDSLEKALDELHLRIEKNAYV